jgi:hypothetical protein
VPTNAGKGVTIISWNSGTAKDCQVYVSDNGAPENLFARGKEGSTKVDWIQSKHHYDFRLYQGSERSKLLSEVKVMPQ